MKAELKTNGVNQILKETVIYEKGDFIDSLALVVKGRVHLQTEGMSLAVGSGYFLGMVDLPKSVHGITYTAETNSVIYVFSVEGSLNDVAKIHQVNKDYGMLMVSGLGRNIQELNKLYQDLNQTAEDVFYFASRAYRKCQSLAHKAGIDTEPFQKLEELRPYKNDQLIDKEKVEYYQACCKLPREVQNAYYGASSKITAYQVNDQISLIYQLQTVCQNYAVCLKQVLELLIHEKQNLFQFTAGLAAALQRMGEDDSEIMSELDGIIDRIDQIETLLSERTGMPVEIDREFMEETYFELLNPSTTEISQTKAVEVADDMVALVEDNLLESVELTDVLEMLLEYAEMPEEDAEKLVSLLDRFQSLPDKMSTEDSVRAFRREICKIYYPLYQKIFLRDYHSSEETPVWVDLFLRYGLLSETLVTDEMIEALLGLDNRQAPNNFCGVYDMKEWLTAILEGKKEPSKNEFDMDYSEYLRDQKKRKAITEQEYVALGNDTKKKLEFEINNMFRNNHRLVSGQITSFVPFLYQEAVGSSLINLFLSKDKLNAAINRIRRIDYSVFYREGLCPTKNASFEKEYIQEEVAPDFIVFPIYGSRGIMWQELSGPRRNSKGRILFPAFFEGNFERMVIQVMGAFRWELCRTIQGAYWNNITVKSLTSEYSDFIQFYRKNKELSEERKEKLKLQIQKHRNNSREVFVSDYDNWIRHEAKGGMVLSKQVREIMATYCPFQKTIRGSIAGQPLFRDAYARFERQRAKKQREYDLKFRIWEKEGAVIPETIIATRDYYAEQ